MSPWKGRLAVTLVFLLGFISGAATAVLIVQRKEREVFGSRDIIARMTVYRLSKDLNLTPLQEKEVFDAVLESRRELLTLRKDLLPVFLGVLDRTTARISKVLDPKQKEKFDTILKERRRVLDGIVKESETRPSPAVP